MTVRIRSATLQLEAYLLHVRLTFFVSLSILSLDAVDTAGVVQPSCLSPVVFGSHYVAAYLMASTVVQLLLEQQRCAEQPIPCG